MPRDLILVATLTVRVASRADFYAYEAEAGQAMKRAGGQLEREIEIEGEVDGFFRVVHLVRFPTREAYARYREDPELVALAELRAKAIAKTEVLSGWDSKTVP